MATWLMFFLCLIQCALINSQNVSNSKLSLYTGMGNSSSLSWDFIRNTMPRIVEIVGDFSTDNTFGAPKMVKQVSPNTIIIGYIPGPQTQQYPPDQCAIEWWQIHNETILANKDYVDYWIGYNEPESDTLSRVQWINEFEIKRMEIMSTYNIKACIGNFPVGNPDIYNGTVIAALYPMFSTALKYDAILGVHEYNAAWMTTWYNNVTAHGINTARYRALYDQFIVPNGYGNVKVAVTALGITGALLSNECANCGYKGWQRFCDYWCYEGGSCNCQHEYAQQLEWYDSIMLRDNYVIGGAIYLIDLDGWESWQLTKPVIDELTAYMNKL